MNPIFSIFILLSFAFANLTVVTIGGHNYSETDFYEFYPKTEWGRLKDDQKENLLKDYIRRTTAVLEAKAMNLHIDPSVAIKLRNRSDKFIVNRSYEHFVAMPLIDNEYLELARKNIKRELLVSHILIGYQGSELQTGFSRSLDEAYQSASNILLNMTDSSNFSDIALQYSEDPGVRQNNGRLGWIFWGKVDPDFQKEVFILEMGDVSNPILTKFGYHIVYIEDERASEVVVYPDEKVEERVYYSSMGSVRHLLKDEAEKYDGNLLGDLGFKLNNSLVEELAVVVSDEKNRSSYMNNIDLVPIFEDFQNNGIFVVFGNRGYGLGWFVNRMKKIPPSQRPKAVDRESLERAFRTFVLQYVAEQRAYDAGLESSYGFKAHAVSVEIEILYDSFVRYLVNNAPDPTENQMRVYYEKNRAEKYVDLEKFSVRNLKVENKSDIEHYFMELSAGADFDKIARNHSLINPENGGKMKAFDRSSYKEICAALKGVAVGEFSKPFEARDRNWSIVMLDEIIPEKTLPFDRVKTRIKTALKKVNQDNHKEDTFKQLQAKYNVIVNPEFFSHTGS